MRITLDIPDDLHTRLKALAKREGTTMRVIVLRGIERELVETPNSAKQPRFPVLKSARPDSLKIDNETIYDRIDFPRC